MVALRAKSRSLDYAAKRGSARDDTSSFLMHFFFVDALLLSNDFMTRSPDGEMARALSFDPCSVALLLYEGCG
jgi:hypothetical protein